MILLAGSMPINIMAQDPQPEKPVAETTNPQQTGNRPPALREATLNYSTNVLSELPYDQPFTLRITNLPNVRKLNIVIHEMKGNFKKFKNQGSITEEDFMKNKDYVFTYKGIVWESPSKEPVTEAAISIPFYLVPNRPHIISVLPDAEIRLTEEEKADFTEKINSSSEIKRQLADFATKFIAGKNGPLSYKSFVSAVNAEVTKIVQGVPGFEYNPITPDTREQGLFLDAIEGYMQYQEADVQFINKMSGLLKNKKSSDAAKVDNLKKAAKPDSSALRKLQAEIEGIDSALQKLAALPKPPTFAEATEDPELLTRRTEEFRKLCLRFNACESVSMDELSGKASNLPRKPKETYDALIERITAHIVKHKTLGYSYPLNMTDQAKHYIGLDLGLAYVGNFSSFEPYAGLNIYFRPVNPSVPLSQYKNFWELIGTRMSLLIGITVSDIEKENVRKGIIGNNGLIIGTGFRLNSWFRINGGGLCYYKYDNPDLLNTSRTSTRVSPFISASIDIDVREMLGALGTSVFRP